MAAATNATTTRIGAHLRWRELVLALASKFVHPPIREPPPLEKGEKEH
jgi:hypothetical protein